MTSSYPKSLPSADDAIFTLLTNFSSNSSKKLSQKSCQKPRATAGQTICLTGIDPRRFSSVLHANQSNHPGAGGKRLRSDCTAASGQSFPFSSDPADVGGSSRVCQLLIGIQLESGTVSVNGQLQADPHLSGWLFLTKDALGDSSRQWWVSDARYELIRPFYGLRVSPVLPEDSGTYRCRLETDPLFAVTLSTAQQELAVMVRPVPPSSPEVKAFSNRSVTLVWTHNAARAHRPVLRFSVAVRTVADSTRFVMAAPSNASTVIVDNLAPFTLYAFAVRAENAAGESDFGPETTFRTLGEAPVRPPDITGVRNATKNCVEVSVEPPDEMHGDLVAYVVVLQMINKTEPVRKVFKSPTPESLKICDLTSSAEYAMTIEADNGFGTSPPARAVFRTEPDLLDLAPSNFSASAVVGKPEVTVTWPAPSADGKALDIVKYHLYYREESATEWQVEHLSVGKIRPKIYKYRLSALAPATKYLIRLSASSSTGEGRKSDEVKISTDVEVPGTATLKTIAFDCKNGVKLSWEYPQKKSPLYTVQVANRTSSMTFNTSLEKLDVIDLKLNDEYAVQILVSEKSVADNFTLLQGPWSPENRFLLSENCNYQSSLCSGSTGNCLKLAMQLDSSRPISILIGVIAIILFAMICFLIAHLARGSINFKQILKKKEKCVYLEEVSPLVYDSVGHEDIPVELFYGYVEDLKRNDNAKFKAQFQQVEQATYSGKHDTTDAFSENVEKNRYMNIGAIEETRIRLNSPHNGGNDYINANYIDSCEKRHAYIATQAPLPSTFEDFWGMVWQERCSIVVMITNMVEDGRRKCDQYWPSNVNAHQTYGNYEISLVSETSNAHFVHRTLCLRIAKSVPQTERKVHQLHFTGWPDHGVPATVFPLLDFVHYVSDIQSTGPIVVHCSAGVGRSGSYILLDSMRRHLVNFRKLNVLGHLLHMRRQREKLVQTLEQYVFCHEAIRQLIRHGITRVHSDLFMRYLHYLAEENMSGKTRLQMQFEDICECRHSPACVVNTDFLVLPGHHRLDEFIVATWQTEVEDLWRLVWKKSCQTIVFLTTPGSEESFWKKLTAVDTMTVQHSDNFVLLQNNEEQLCVRIVCVSRSDLEIDFWREVENVQKQRIAYHDAPLLILSPVPKIGVSASGIHPTSLPSPRGSTLSLSLLANDHSPSLPYAMCALTTLACQLETTGCIDVVQVLSSYAHIQCGLWTSKQDIEIIYEKISLLVGGTRV
ncbi:unnamed protein product [Caenorhabditis auriculariae]|uniref:protein-tyrosine-phosphatase n=1 Tax=Caenorhabditis auriculariae TaxID=2777116 RepID=A0A8S1HHN9_9PELO|nr:unnamed protein product [Caenorhabditis auriculariae]